MNCFRFKLSNDEDYYLTIDMTLEQVKFQVQNNKWIKLSKNDDIFDIQTCNIVYVKELEDYQKIIDELKQTKADKLKIISEIEKYQFNMRMKLWYFQYKLFLYVDEENKDNPYLSYNKEFLEEMLNMCKLYGCKLKEDN